MYKRKKAFTLAEILITLSIIGVISAMVLPRMMKSMEEKVLATKAKHFYSLMSQMTRTYMANNGMFSLKNLVDCTQTECAPDKTSGTLQHMIESTLKIANKCSSLDDCFPVMFIGRSEMDMDRLMKGNENAPAYILLDGYVIAMTRRDLQEDIRLLVDVNGKEGPNMFGRDLWYMYIKNDGSVTGHSSWSQGECNYNYAVCFGNFVKTGYKFHIIDE